jgi:hypothetical protein
MLRILSGFAIFLSSALKGDAEPGPTQARTFLKSYCTQCHGAEKQKGKVTFHDLVADLSDTENTHRWIEVLDQLTAGDMPPEDEKQPPPEERDELVAWIQKELARSDQGEAYRLKLLAPEYGNWVDHDKLFSGEITDLPYSPSRLWRYSPEIFGQKNLGRIRSPFTYNTPERALRDYSAMSTVDQSTVQMILINADQFLTERKHRGDFKAFTTESPLPSQKELENTLKVEFLRIIGRPPSEAEHTKYLSFFKESIALGGPHEGLATLLKALFLKPEAIYRMEFGLGEKDAHGRRHLSSDEIVTALAFALTDQGPDKNKILWKAYQSDRLKTSEDVKRVVRAMLNDDQGNWSHPRYPRIMRFFEQFFGFDKAGDVFKDQQRRNREAIRQWNPDILVHDAKMLIEHILGKDHDVIAELLTTNKYFVAHPGDNQYAREFYDEKVATVTAPDYVEQEVAKRKVRLAERRKKHLGTEESWQKIYDNELKRARQDAERIVERFRVALDQGMTPHPNFPFTRKSRGLADLLYIAPYNLPTNARNEIQKWNWPVEQPYQMPAEQRAGILTHPAWLAAWSVNDGNDPIHRGIWVREKLLAGKLNDVPPDVDAKVPLDPHKTLRERMEPLRAERCWNCHRKINPLGETFEMFDDWGRFRTEVYFGKDGKMVHRRDNAFEQMKKKGELVAKAVDPSGAITGSGDPTIDGQVKNAVEMLHRLGRSERARQSFIRHLFRYFMGRNEMLSDSQTLIAAEKAYLDNDGSFQALVISLLSSDSFLYRR